MYEVITADGDLLILPGADTVIANVGYLLDKICAFSNDFVILARGKQLFHVNCYQWPKPNIYYQIFRA